MTKAIDINNPGVKPLGRRVKMDSRATFAELKMMVKAFCEEREWDQYNGPKDLVIGIVTEAGELLEKFRFKSESQVAEMLSDPGKRKEIGEELADVLYFVVRFAQMNGFDLSDEFIKKMGVNQRKYPLKTSKGSNSKYNEH